MKKLFIACALIISTSVFACPECGGLCDESSKMPKIEMQGDFIVYKEICEDLFKDKDTFIRNLIEFNVISSKKDVIIWDKDMIVVKAKKKDSTKTLKRASITQILELLKTVEINVRFTQKV